MLIVSNFFRRSFARNRRLVFGTLRMASSTARRQPTWTAPKAAENVKLPPLKVYNSLTRSKTDFIPQDSKNVTWYACGPTVYDDAHLGHARNYVSTDIIRRILKDYFGFNVKFVMNITDVDDKIILRGRQRYLLAEFKKTRKSINDEVLSSASSAFSAHVKKNLPDLPDDPETFSEAAEKAYSKTADIEAKTKMHLKTAESAAAALKATKTSPDSINVEDFYSQTEDILLPYLDSLHGSSIDASDHSIFTKLTKAYEARFFDDMHSLNVLDPDVLTRVTEYGPQIVDFVAKVVDNKFAYQTSDGSVYFDIEAFEKAGNPYARLEPWNRGDKDLQADGEGALTKKTSEKRSDADFAVWKSSKPGEPAWKSPWGMGRPGWHIECSVMASETLGKVMDIHSGGIDLAFPHHDNELAQSEAYWACDSHGHEWVKYFLHMGHLSIQGQKMSKSLKNFTTIREALSPLNDESSRWTPRALRIVFLFGYWKDGVEITDDLIKAGRSWEEKVINFFLKAKDLERSGSYPSNHSTSKPHSRSESDHDSDSHLAKAISLAQQNLYDALCDSFNTPVAMRILSDIISEYNSLPASSLSTGAVLELARWVTKIVTIFGLNGKANPSDSSSIGWEGIDISADAQPFIYPLSRLRDELRKQARSGTFQQSDIVTLTNANQPDQIAEDASPGEKKYADLYRSFVNDVKSKAESGAPANDFLALCDTLRDVRLWDLDIYLEDRDPPLGALIRPLDESLKKSRADKEAREREKREAKVRRDKEEAERKRLRDEVAKVEPDQLFRTAEWSEWDDDGVPTKDAAGTEVPKSRRKKLTKEWEKQKKLHEEWLKSGATK